MKGGVEMQRSMKLWVPNVVIIQLRYMKQLVTCIVKNNYEYKFLFNEYLSCAGHVPRALHLLFLFILITTLLLSLFYTRGNWLERFGNLSKVTQLDVTNRIQTKVGLSPKPVLFFSSMRILKAITEALLSEVLLHDLFHKWHALSTVMLPIGHLST